MKNRSWREKMVYTLNMIVHTAIVLGFVVCASGHADMEKWDSPSLCHTISTPPGSDYSNWSHPGGVGGSETSIGNFSLKSMLEVPMELLNLQNIRDAADKVDRSS